MQPDLLQFHGSEAPGFAESFARPYIKAVPMGSIENLGTYMACIRAQAGFFSTATQSAVSVAAVSAFDWTRVPRDPEHPIVLAGGLDLHNVAQAIALVRPYAVDVSSGIESAPGIKDAAKMHGFVNAVRAADAATIVSAAGST